MKRKVTITLEVNPTEYYGAQDDDLGALRLVQAMLNGNADFPYKECQIQCGVHVCGIEISSIDSMV